jgi:hypothetical protein
MPDVGLVQFLDKQIGLLDGLHSTLCSLERSPSQGRENNEASNLKNMICEAQYVISDEAWGKPPKPDSYPLKLPESMCIAVTIFCPTSLMQAAIIHMMFSETITPW